MILLALGAVTAQPAETPTQFMQRLYASYRKRDYSPFDHPDRVFAPRLAAALAEDAKLANGEMGYLDGDPVCQCQDTAGMRATVVNVTPLGTDKALVRVSIGFTGTKARMARFSLERGGRGWRIADVSSADEVSLLRAVEDSNRKQREKH